MTEPPRLYIVHGFGTGGTVTYHCPSPEWAVRKYRDLIAGERSGVTITGPGGQSLSLMDLEDLSAEPSVPAARLPAHSA